MDAAASGTRELKSDSQGAHAPAERLRGHTRSYVVFSRLPLGAISTTGLSGKAIECFIQNTRFAVAASFDSIRKHVSVPQRSACVFVSRSVVCGFFYAAFLPRNGGIGRLAAQTITLIPVPAIRVALKFASARSVGMLQAPQPAMPIE
ncbi:MAG: hypothetical protein OSB38_42800 [Paraburkholderia fungorum]|nr:hypothetical protein [Paraburkholderia fungorum]